MQPIGILGGAFDPIHNGHTGLALQACAQLGLAQVRLIPVNIPAHRDMPIASANDRRAMLRLAIADNDELVIDERELDRKATSYTINTLQSLRDEFPGIPLCLIMGRDAFAGVNSWHQWQNLLDYAHIIVANRPGRINGLSATLENWINQHKTNRLDDIRYRPAGRIYLIEIPLVNISATAIRAAMADNINVKEWLHAATLKYIKGHKLYREGR